MPGLVADSEGLANRSQRLGYHQPPPTITHTTHHHKQLQYIPAVAQPFKRISKPQPNQEAHTHNHKALITCQHPPQSHHRLQPQRITTRTAASLSHHQHQYPTATHDHTAPPSPTHSPLTNTTQHNPLLTTTHQHPQSTRPHHHTNRELQSTPTHSQPKRNSQLPPKPHHPP